MTTLQKVCSVWTVRGRCRRHLTPPASPQNVDLSSSLIVEPLDISSSSCPPPPPSRPHRRPRHPVNTIRSIRPRARQPLPQTLFTGVDIQKVRCTSSVDVHWTAERAARCMHRFSGMLLEFYGRRACPPLDHCRDDPTFPCLNGPSANARPRSRLWFRATLCFKITIHSRPGQQRLTPECRSSEDDGQILPPTTHIRRCQGY